MEAPLRTPRALAGGVVRSISLAIDFAHKNGVTHSDIKPDNILLKRGETASSRIVEPVVTDFGLTKLLGTPTNSLIRDSLTTAYYISPEQAQGKGGNERSDLYSLGVILYEIFTGVVPFHGNRPLSLMMQHINAPPTPPDLITPNVSPALSQVILCSLAKKPTERFANAPSMTVALAKALNVAVPEELSHLDLPDLPPRLAEPLHTKYNLADLPVTTKKRAAIRNTRYEAAKEQVAEVPLRRPARAVNPMRKREPMKPGQRRGLLLALVATLIVLLASLMLGILSLLSHGNADTTSQVIGHAFFVNSGQVNDDSNQGINDELQIDLHAILEPAAGKSYYVWLLADKSQSEAPAILLGKIPIKNGEVHFLYHGNQQHTNLFTFASRLLITEEDANSAPSSPTPDVNLWRYYAEIYQTPDPADKLHFSILGHLRHLLVESPELTARGLHGGLAIWLLANTRTVLELANSANGGWHEKDAHLIHNQVIRILDYIDGESFVRADVPAGTPMLANSRNAQVALLGPAPVNADPAGYNYGDEVSPGYVYLIGIHLDSAVQSTAATVDQHRLAIQINSGINEVKRWLQQVQQDAKLLVHMTDAQLLQPASLSILEDMVMQAQNAYAGQLNPSTGQSQGGAIWIYGNIQRMATFDIRPFVAPSQ